MPHFGLMDEDALGPIEGPLMRAKLHIRGAIRRMRQGKTSLAIITLYDALVSALYWYINAPEKKKNLQIREDDNLKDDKTIFNVLKRSGVLDGEFDYETFDALVTKALTQELPAGDYSDVFKGIESVMTQLGIMPFDESKLPPEDPSTF
jgi:hypothetical protein